MPYKYEILSSYLAWKKAEDKMPEHDYAINYKAKLRTARRHWNTFVDVCKAEGLHTIEVAANFRDNNLFIHL